MVSGRWWVVGGGWWLASWPAGQVKVPVPVPGAPRDVEMRMVRQRVV